MDGDGCSGEWGASSPPLPCPQFPVWGQSGPCGLREEDVYLGARSPNWIQSLTFTAFINVLRKGFR